MNYKIIIKNAGTNERIKISILKSNTIRDATNSVIIMQDWKTEWERAIRDWKYYS